MGMRDLSAGLDELGEIVRSYESFFHVKSTSEKLNEQVSNSENIWNRNNWNGHLTSSAIVLSADHTQCLFMHHRKLGIDLTPGGHCDPFEHPAETAERELREETGLREVCLHSWHTAQKCPIDVDTHLIPPNSIKQEPPHFHHDFRYVFVSSPDCDVSLNQTEGTWLGWKDITFLDELYPRVYDRIRRQL